ncbi:hypothetical protein PRDchartreuse_17 [Enterobacteria phage PRDchartreuse]
MRGNLALAMILFGFVVYAANNGAFGRLLYVIGFRDKPEGY